MNSDYFVPPQRPGLGQRALARARYERFAAAPAGAPPRFTEVEMSAGEEDYAAPPPAAPVAWAALAAPPAPRPRFTEVEMSTGEEDDAFVPPAYTAQSPSVADDVDLRVFRLNDMEYTTPIGDIFVDQIDAVHCKAFGQPTGIKITRPNGNYSLEYQGLPSVNPGFTPTGASYLTILTQGDMLILIAIVCVSTNASFGNSLDIWSVAKNPNVISPNAVEVYFDKLKESELYTPEDVRYIHLNVGNDNTVRMTEAGRLRLYGSLGFDILPNTRVEIVYPPGDGIVVDSIIETVRVADIYGKLHCTYIGNIKSPIDGIIVMFATKATFGIKRDMYLGLQDVFKGKKFGLFVNGKYTAVDEAPLDNAKIRIAPEPSAYVPITSIYHMGITKTNSPRYPGNNYIEYTIVPSNFVVMTLTSPGSYLFGTGETFIDVFTRLGTVVQNGYITTADLIERHRSNARFPIYNIENHDDSVRTIAAEAVNQTVCDNQIGRSVINSIIIESLGKQPIYETPIYVTGQLANTTKFQTDIQIYTEGMAMHNFEMKRDSAETPGAAPVFDAAQALHDDNMVMGTFSGDTRINDIPFVNVDFPAKTLAYYFQHIVRTVYLPPGQKYFMILFGCAAVEKGAEEVRNYELLYELSHRRSVKHTFPLNTPVNSDLFLDTAVLQTGPNLSFLGPEPSAECREIYARLGLQGGAPPRKKRKPSTRRGKRKMFARKSRKTGL